MSEQMISLLPEIGQFVGTLQLDVVPEDRKVILQNLIEHFREKRNNVEQVNLNFICTHNSRRSQFAQVWGQTAAAYYGVEVNSYSGGVEVTACDPRTVASLERTGFRIEKEGEENPLYTVRYSEEAAPVKCYSKLFNDPANPTKDLVAVMTCSDADEDCPFIPGAEKRIALNYEDPKAFDGTPQEAGKYDECSRQIATEMFYVFEKIRV